MAEDYVKFSDEAVENSMRSAEAGDSLFSERSLNDKPIEDVVYALRAECLKVNVTNKGVCVGLPLSLGDVCIPIPIGIDIGTVAEACLDIYYKKILGIKIPAGVEVSVYVAGRLVANIKFGL